MRGRLLIQFELIQAARSARAIALAGIHRALLIECQKFLLRRVLIEFLLELLFGLPEIVGVDLRTQSINENGGQPDPDQDHDPHHTGTGSISVGTNADLVWPHARTRARRRFLRAERSGCRWSF